MSVTVVVAGPGREAKNAGAIGAKGLLVLDVQPHAGVAERPVAAVAGDVAAVNDEDLGFPNSRRGRGGAEWHCESLLGAEAGY